MAARGAPVAAQRVVVHLGARYAALVSQHLGHLELSPELVVDDAQEFLAERPLASPGVGGHRGAAHALDAAGNGQVVVPRHDAGGDEVHRLL